MFIGKYNMSVVLTYIGAAVAVSGMMLAMQGRVKEAFLMLIIAGICDLFDGVIARKIKRNEEEQEFGVQIDSLVDIISFGAFPITILYALGLNQWYHSVVFIAYILCVIIRLAYFNVYRTSGGYYKGLPVTYAALIFTLLYCSTLVVSGITNIIFTAAVISVSVLYILNIKIKKPEGIWYGIFGVLAISVALFIIKMA